MSLSPASARQTRIARVIASQPNLVERARMQGFYDFMLALPSQAAAQGEKLEVSYEQGWARAQRKRVALNGRAWYETEKEREGGKWTWRIYREGFFEVQGQARTERAADQDIEVATADLKDHYGDWAPRYAGAPAAEEDDVEQDADEAPRM
jgi:hypothetical protein